jgi:hypothetical protein
MAARNFPVPKAHHHRIADNEPCGRSSEAALGNIKKRLDAAVYMHIFHLIFIGATD